MIDPKAGVWLLPTRQRLAKLRTFLNQANARGRSTDIVLLVQKDELATHFDDYRTLTSTFNCGYFATKAEGMAAKCQEHYELNRNYSYEWIGVLSDDLIPCTDEWDTKLISRLNGYNFVTPDDGWQAPNRIGGGGLVLSGDLVRALGFLAPPNLSHLFWDDVLETIGRDMNVWTYAPDVLLEHKHAALEAKPIDSTTRAVASFWEADEKAYRIWRRKDREAAGERVAALMRQKGVQMIDTDLRGVRLLVTTPSPGPEFDAGFMDSLLATKLLVEKCGGEFEFHKLPGCSDIVYGRSVLFTGFVNSDYTHNLMADADMRWAPMDVVRMIKRGLPFVAAAGPRKGDGKMVFAATNADDHGVTFPARVHADGLVEVTEVGGAFVLVDRRFADAMTSAHQDLRFQDASGRTHYGLWLPTIKDLRYRGEDYAMCRRWRAAGGTVYVLATVTLGHTGVKTWSGAFVQQIAEEQEELRRKQENNDGTV